MQEEWEGVRIISVLMALSGLALVTYLFWAGILWPFGLIAFGIIFPFVNRHVVDIFLAPMLYGAVDLGIAYGLWVRSKSSRIALVCLGLFWIVYAVWDSVAIRRGAYGNPDYYEVDPFVLANAVCYGIIIAYLFLSKNARAYFGKKETQ